MIGGHAVANWIARIDLTLVRNTRDIDIMIRRADLPTLIPAMAKQGWIHAQTSGIDLFIDGENGKPSEGIHLIFADEKFRPTDPIGAPTIDETEDSISYRVVSLEGLVRLKLLANRRKDQVHLQDLIQAGLLDSSWPEKYPPPLDERLRILLADPEG